MAREHWRHQFDFFVTLVGYGVGSGAFIKFPFYCMRNGGVIPWDNCNNTWNTPACVSNTNLWRNVSIPPYNASEIGNTSKIKGVTAAEEFWKNKVLEMTDGLMDLGGITWHLLGCLVITHVIIFLWIFKGIKVSGKLVYITVALPIILITVLLIRGCLLPGSADGIYYYIYPKLERLMEPKVWIQSCSYALHSLGIATGCIITMSGRNRMDNNCLKNAVLLCLVDSLTAVITGFAFFTIVGHAAYMRGVRVDALESSGYNLAFIVYPEMLASLPFPQSWSVLTFATLMMLGIDSMVPGTESIAAALEDLFTQCFKKRLFFTCAVLLSTLLFALIYVSQGGIYVVTLVDWYAYFPSTALIAMLECIVVGWLYGTERLQTIVSGMWKQRVPLFMVISLKFVCPVLLLVTFSYSLYSYRPPKYDDYIYPTWAAGVGWMISLASILPIPIMCLWTICNRNESTLKEKLKRSMEPSEYWADPTGTEVELHPVAGHGRI
ncbi:sodium- and chloride-dependent glycine transporter 1-like isoform X2 [Haliotis asinina]|uniref:sodium- and chloride-dependent glycine transporter 1-like isoform X2 n=1 Tax=Haliotis asinina TaxID=109174 RepID=UPI00353278A4